MLERLLRELQAQQADRLFTYSILVVDNDYNLSAKNIIDDFNKNANTIIEYYCEPEQNIALARNKTIKCAKGNYVAFIDDDEFPSNDWLLILYKTIKKYEVTGVLGPVKPFFEKKPPDWIIKGKFYEKQPPYKTGQVLAWTDTRTSNALLIKDLFDRCENLFDPKFGRGGEDRDFFRRMIDKGHKFVWCTDAAVFELVTPERYSRSFMIRRALLRGKVSLTNTSLRKVGIIKSLAASLLYTSALPFLCFMSHHIYMKYLIKNFEHIGKLLAVLGLDVIKQKYVMK
jgi:glycosyltransferase involved in cell wall biosynthesis